MSYLIGFAVGVGVGALVRLFGLPAASPPSIAGVLVVVGCTVGWLAVNRLIG